MKFTDEKLKDIYKEFSLSACWSPEGKEKRMQQARFDYGQVSDMFKGMINVFDVGAAGGFFLQAFKEQKWLVEGSELSHFMIKYAKEHFDITLRYGFLRDTITRADLYIFWNVLEHLPDPVEAIGLVKGKLVSGGMVYTNIPLNDGSYPHVTVFTEGSIAELFKDFKCIYCNHNREAKPNYIIQLWKKR